VRACVEGLRAFFSEPVNAFCRRTTMVLQPRNTLAAAVASLGIVVPVLKIPSRKTSGAWRAASTISPSGPAPNLNPRIGAEGTFSITNPGVLRRADGAFPVINQPNVADP